MSIKMIDKEHPLIRSSNALLCGPDPYRVPKIRSKIGVSGLYSGGLMKAVILAGGLGSRISEESHLRPKPMIEIGGKPILWHIMKMYSHYGINDFVICLGYKGYVIKEYFANYFLHMSDVTFDIGANRMEVHEAFAEPWRVTLVDTGPDTMTGGRLRRVASYIRDEAFCFTYGDGVADIDIGALIKFHHSHGKMATVTAIQPPGRYGALNMQGSAVHKFQEKPVGDGAWINGGFFVLEPAVLDLIVDDQMSWEDQPLVRLANDDQLMAYQHTGFWQAMDTLRDKNQLEDLWRISPPWKVWL
jgi:glucose-1-phosphate cytidylyltransferase